MFFYTISVTCIIIDYSFNLSRRRKSVHTCHESNELPPIRFLVTLTGVKGTPEVIRKELKEYNFLVLMILEDTFSNLPSSNNDKSKSYSIIGKISFDLISKCLRDSFFHSKIVHLKHMLSFFRGIRDKRHGQPPDGLISRLSILSIEYLKLYCKLSFSNAFLHADSRHKIGNVFMHLDDSMDVFTFKGICADFSDIADSLGTKLASTLEMLNILRKFLILFTLFALLVYVHGASWSAATSGTFPVVHVVALSCLSVLGSVYLLHSYQYCYLKISDRPPREPVPTDAVFSLDNSFVNIASDGTTDDQQDGSREASESTEIYGLIALSVFVLLWVLYIGATILLAALVCLSRSHRFVAAFRAAYTLCAPRQKYFCDRLTDTLFSLLFLMGSRLLALGHGFTASRFATTLTVGRRSNQSSLKNHLSSPEPPRMWKYIFFLMHFSAVVTKNVSLPLLLLLSGSGDEEFWTWVVTSIAVGTAIDFCSVADRSLPTPAAADRAAVVEEGCGSESSSAASEADLSSALRSLVASATDSSVSATTSTTAGRFTLPEVRIRNTVLIGSLEILLVDAVVLLWQALLLTPYRPLISLVLLLRLSATYLRALRSEVRVKSGRGAEIADSPFLQYALLLVLRMTVVVTTLGQAVLLANTALDSSQASSPALTPADTITFFILENLFLILAVTMYTLLSQYARIVYVDSRLSLAPILHYQKPFGAHNLHHASDHHPIVGAPMDIDRMVRQLMQLLGDSLNDGITRVTDIAGRYYEMRSLQASKTQSAAMAPEGDVAERDQQFGQIEGVLSQVCAAIRSPTALNSIFWPSVTLSLLPYTLSVIGVPAAVTGIAVIASFGFQFRLRQYHARRVELAVLNDPTLLSLVASDLLPSWFTASDCERTEWLTQALRLYWPHMSKILGESLLGTLNPIMASVKPSMLGCLEFSKASLGTVAPIITSVKTYPASSSLDKVVRIDLELNWVGNPDVVIKAGFSNSLCVLGKLQNLTLAAKMRLELCGLQGNAWPGFETFSVCFMKRPLIDFRFLLGGDNMNLDLMNVGTNTHNIASVVDSVLRDALSSLYVYPKRWQISFSDEIASDKLPVVGILTLTVKAGKRLAAMDLLYSDPYVIVESMNEMERTPVLYMTTNPVWTKDNSFDFQVYDKSEHSVKLTVFDKDQVTKDDFMGEAFVSIAHLEDFARQELAVPLRGQSAEGELVVELTYKPTGKHAAAGLSKESAEKATPVKSNAIAFEGEESDDSETSDDGTGTATSNLVDASMDKASHGSPADQSLRQSAFGITARHSLGGLQYLDRELLRSLLTRPGLAGGAQDAPMPAYPAVDRPRNMTGAAESIVRPRHARANGSIVDEEDDESSSANDETSNSQRAAGADSLDYASFLGQSCKSPLDVLIGNFSVSDLCCKEILKGRPKVVVHLRISLAGKEFKTASVLVNADHPTTMFEGSFRFDVAESALSSESLRIEVLSDKRKSLGLRLSSKRHLEGMALLPVVSIVPALNRQGTAAARPGLGLSRQASVGRGFNNHLLSKDCILEGQARPCTASVSFKLAWTNY